jgi:hypothetical protein
MTRGGIPLENLYKNIFPNVGGVNVKQDKKY